MAICQRTINEPRAFIEASRGLCRIRSTSTNHIYLRQPRDTTTAATKLGKEDSPRHSGEDTPYLVGYLDMPSPVLKRLDPGQELEGSSTLKGREHEIDVTPIGRYRQRGRVWCPLGRLHLGMDLFPTPVGEHASLQGL